MGDALLNSKKGVQRRRSIPTDFALRVHMTSSACSEFILKGSFRPLLSPFRGLPSQPETCHSLCSIRTTELVPCPACPVSNRAIGYPTDMTLIITVKTAWRLPHETR